MKPVNQSVVSAKDGDCLGACIASILEIDQYPNFHTNKTGSWLDRWNEYLAAWNMQIIEYPLGSFPVPVGYAILVVKSALFEGVRHAVVFHGDGYDGEVVHNPNPQDPRGIDIPNEDWLAFKVLALIDPSKAVRLK